MLVFINRWYININAIYINSEHTQKRNLLSLLLGGRLLFDLNFGLRTTTFSSDYLLIRELDARNFYDGSGEWDRTSDLGLMSPAL